MTTQPIDDLLNEDFGGYTSGPDVSSFERLTKEDALELLQHCESEGMMHSVWTFMTPFIGAICNCNLDSGCMAMKLTVGYSLPMMWRGEWVAALNREACISCRHCTRVCPFGALAIADGNGSKQVVLDTKMCWGCGICRSVCTPGALSLRDRRSVPDVAALW